MNETSHLIDKKIWSPLYKDIYVKYNLDTCTRYLIIFTVNKIFYARAQALKLPSGHLFFLSILNNNPQLFNYILNIFMIVNSSQSTLMSIRILISTINYPLYIFLLLWLC